MKRGSVTIGYLHPGGVSNCFASSKTELLLFDVAHKQRIVGHTWGEMGLEAHAARIHTARNDIARAILDKSDSEWLFMVDADMGFSPSVVEDLIHAADPTERPVVGGLCFGQKADGKGDFYARRFRIIPTMFRMWETDDEVGFVPTLDYPRNQLVPVDATGAACLLIHRSALQRIRDEYGDSWFLPLDVPKGPHGRTEFSEDMSFCLRLQAVGIQPYVHTGIQTTHDKGGVFLDEETYDLQQLTRTKTDLQYAEWILATGGLLSPMECGELAYWAARTGGPAIEVGNYTGLSTIVISNSLPPGAPFVTVDPHGWRGTAEAFVENVERYGAGNVDSRTERFQEFLAAYDGDPFRFVFYDGPHNDDDCAQFWADLQPHLADDAVICWDDADWASMSKLTELVGASGRQYLARYPLRRHAVKYSTDDPQFDFDNGKRHPSTYTLAVWGRG